MGDSPTLALATDLEIPPCPSGCIYSPVWPWSCHQQHLPRDPERAMFALALGNRSADLGLSCEFWNGLWPSSSLSQSWSGNSQSCLPRNPTTDTPVPASRGNPTDLGPNYGLKSSPLTGLSSIQLWSRTTPAYPGTWWEPHLSMHLLTSPPSVASKTDPEMDSYLSSSPTHQGPEGPPRNEADPNPSKLLARGPPTVGITAFPASSHMTQLQPHSVVILL